MEDKEKIEKIVKEAKDLLTIFEDFKEKTEVNSKTSFFLNIDRTTIARTILPYLNIKDIISFRTTCKDVNIAVSSTVALVSYYKAINNKKNSSKNLGNMMLRQFNELNDNDDIQIELESLKKVYTYI